jgi:hypothetical protein
MMRDRLRQAYALPHALAVAGHPALGGIVHAQPFDGLPRQPVSLLSRQTPELQRLEDKFVATSPRTALGRGMKTPVRA